MCAPGDHRPSFVNSGCVNNEPVRGVQQSASAPAFIIEREKASSWRHLTIIPQVIVKNVHTFDGENAADFIEWYEKIRISLNIYDKAAF